MRRPSGIMQSMASISLANRLSRLPLGVHSKKDMGEWSTLLSSSACRWREAMMPHREMATVVLKRAMPVPTEMRGRGKPERSSGTCSWSVSVTGSMFCRFVLSCEGVDEVGEGPLAAEQLLVGAALRDLPVHQHQDQSACGRKLIRGHQDAKCPGRAAERRPPAHYWYQVLIFSRPNITLSCTVAFWIHACWGTYAMEPWGKTTELVGLRKALRVSKEPLPCEGRLVPVKDPLLVVRWAGCGLPTLPHSCACAPPDTTITITTATTAHGHHHRLRCREFSTTCGMANMKASWKTMHSVPVRKYGPNLRASVLSRKKPELCSLCSFRRSCAWSGSLPPSATPEARAFSCLPHVEPEKPKTLTHDLEAFEPPRDTGRRAN
ncbi:hypothetical protein CRUP_036969 [Coryphaenoides rupestris]|nr:hypothetical protein CRUP_036969 [Coryphaenoides rupestris]